MGKGRSSKSSANASSMDPLQQSLREIEESESAPRKPRISKITTIPAVFDGLENHSAGKKGQSNAVVQALTAVILEKGGDTIPAAYFALLLSSLPNTTDTEELDVMIYLLRLLLPEISPSVITAKFSDVSAVFQSILNENFESALIVVNTLKCIELIMQSSAKSITVQSWKKQPKLVSLFRGLLALSIDPRAKVRKEAQAVIVAMYSHESGAATGTNSAKILGKFLITQLISKDNGEAKKKNSSYLFTLLTAIAIYIPLNILSNLFDPIFALMKQNSNFIRTQGYVLLSSILCHRPTPLNLTVVSKILPEIEGIRPQENDKQSVQYYADVIANATNLLHDMNPTLAAGRISSSIRNLMDLVLSTKYESYESIFSSLETMIDTIVDENIIRTSLNNPDSDLHKLSEELRKGLSMQYQSSWGFVLTLVGYFFNKLNNTCADVMKSTILSLETFAKDATAKCHSVASQTLGIAIRILGPEQILEILPLRFDLPWESKDRREWLLPILQRSISGSKLEIFGKRFLPLLNNLKRQVAEFQSQDNSVAAKHISVLYTQVWELLISFCTFPTDVIENFKNIAKTIGTLLNDEPELRVILCKALATLINRNRSLLQSTEEFYLENEQDDERDDSFTNSNDSNYGSKQVTHELISPAQAQENLQEIGKYAKHFFPILFNLFCNLENNSKSIQLRAAIYNAIKAFSTASDQTVLENFFKAVMKKILENEGKTKNDKKRKTMFIELSKAFVDSVPIVQLEFLFKIIHPHLSDTNAKVQKKSYQVLERLCCRTEYLQSHLEELKQVLVGSLSAAKAASKKNRLRCLRYLVHALPEDPVEQLFSTKSAIPSSMVLAEIIVCVKELNKAAREEAFQLLITLSERSAYYHDDPTHFLNLVIAGLAGTTPHMISATVLALTRLAHEMRDSLPPEFTQSLYQTILILFTTKNREIIKSCLGFVKTSCTILTLDQLRDNMKATVDSIFLWISDSKNRFRLKIKLILQKFIARIGYEQMQRFVPQEHHKLLASVRRDMIRNKDKAGKEKKETNDEQADEEMSDDSDEDMADSDDEFIDQFRTDNDGDEDDEEVVDLLDPNSLKFTKNKKFAQDNAGEFKKDKQGRLVIEEEPEEEQAVPKSVYQMVNEKGGSLGPSKGKRSRLVELDEDEEQSGSNPPKKRQRVGDAKDKYSGKEYKSKKATGDVQVSGRYEPFAYVPMNPQLLNKRKQQKVKKQYKTVVSSAQKGATKGRNIRKKQR